MLTESDMINALNALGSANAIRAAIATMQQVHAPKHLEAEHIRPPDTGYGSAFFLKRRMIATPVTKIVWSKPQTTTVPIPSSAFGDYQAVTRDDELKIVSCLADADCEIGGIVNNETKRADSFIFFTPILEPYVGFDWVENKCLPIEGGYLGLVISKRANQWQIHTAFPCGYPYYSRMGAKVIHKRAGKWAL